MARCTAEEARKTREKLLDAALEVFAEEGVARPSLTKIAERAGMTRGAIYGHFRNKGDLFDALCDRLLMPSEALLRRREEGAQAPLETLEAWVCDVLRKASTDVTHRKLMRVLFLNVELVEGDGDVQRRLMHDLSRVRQHERELLQQAVARGQLPADLDVELALMAVGSMLSGLLRTALLLDMDLTEDADRLAGSLRALLESPSLRAR